jgi:hypothetical protein
VRLSPDDATEHLRVPAINDVTGKSILSILYKGNSLPAQGWMGLVLAAGGILSEVVHKTPGGHGKMKR